MDVDPNNSLVEIFKYLNKDDTEFHKKCLELVQDINEGTRTFLQLIEHLKTLLIDNLPVNRELGMLILSQVLELIPHEKIVPEQLNFVCKFYADRLNDHHQIIPSALRGILALLQFEDLPEGITKLLLISLFQNIPCQQQQQIDRLNIFKILEISLERNLVELQEMGFDFVYGVISAIDGERDPRNLLFLFNWLPKFLKHFTLGHLSEEMFEVMACYFPVDFRAPPQDPNNLSRETLASALSTCLCASPEFSEYCLPLVLEKLSSSLHIAKLDSLDVLARGCAVFPVSAYIQHSTDIWSQIQREVFNNNDEELVKVALQTLVLVMNKLSQSPDNIYKPILSDITDTVKGNLLPNMKLFVPSCKILHSLAKSSKIAASFVVEEVVQMMVNTYNITMTASHQVSILNNLSNFVCIYADLFEDNNIMENKPLSLVPCLCLNATLHVNAEVRAAGLKNLSLISKSIPFELRICFYENLCTSLISEQSKMIRSSLLECFKNFAQIYENEVQCYVLNNINVNSNNCLHLYLESLTAIVQIKTFTESVLSIMVKFCEMDLNTANIAINSLRQLLEIHSNNTKIQLYLGEKAQILHKLLDLIIKYINIVDANVPNHKLLLNNISSICKLVLGYQTSELQRTILSTKLDGIITLYKNCHKSYLIVILDGLISCLHKDIVIECDVVEDLLDAALNSEDEYIQPIAIQLLANILNKTIDEIKLEKDLNIIGTNTNKVLDSNKVNFKNLISVVSWITKALLMRGHNEGANWTNKLLKLLEEHQDAAKGFEIIMQEHCPSLCDKTFCNIRILYRQKFFMEITSILTQHIDENNNDLLAIGYILKEVPKQVFIMQFKKIIKIVLLCLEKCEDGEVLCVVLESLCDLIQSKEPVTEEYLQELLPRFISLTTFKSSMNVRMKALECIQHFTSGYPLYKLLPHKQDIIQSLTICLGDKKRLVRKVAIDARLSWIMLDAPT